MAGPSIEIRSATRDEMPEAVAAIVAAFVTDPLARFAWPSPHGYLRAMPLATREIGVQRPATALTGPDPTTELCRQAAPKVNWTTLLMSRCNDLLGSERPRQIEERDSHGHYQNPYHEEDDVDPRVC